MCLSVHTLNCVDAPAQAEVHERQHVWLPTVQKGRLSARKGPAVPRAWGREQRMGGLGGGLHTASPAAACTWPVGLSGETGWGLRAERTEWAIVGTAGPGG